MADEAKLENHIRDQLPSDLLPFYIGDIPSLDEEAACIQRYDGYPSTEFFGMPPESGSSSILRPLIKVGVRSKAYAVGSGMCEQVKAKLHRFHDDYILSSMIVGDTIYLGRNDYGLCEFQTSFLMDVKEG